MIRMSTLWQTHHGLKAVFHTVFELWPKTSSGIGSDDPKSKVLNFVVAHLLPDLKKKVSSFQLGHWNVKVFMGMLIFAGF